jgi:hypothetical protein
MSQGLTTYDFVQQVYYAQEKVVLDFWPDDDKFKEVLFEANLILQELQSAEDWGWLRERLELGDCHQKHGRIPEFRLPAWVYKPSTLYSDTLKLYKPTPHGGLNNARYIEVPLVTAGNNQHRKDMQITSDGVIHITDPRLKAVQIGDIITFNRLLFPLEQRCIAVMDVQKRISPFHICDERCEVIKEIEKKVDGEWVTEPLLKPVCKSDADIIYKKDRDGDGNVVNHIVGVTPHLHLTEIPDPNYVVMATAARHAEGSPPAQGRIAGLSDAAAKILSAMRQNDAAATDSEYIEWDIPGYYEVV